MRLWRRSIPLPLKPISRLSCNSRRLVLFSTTTWLDKTHPSVIHQSITSSAWVPNTPILDYSACTWLEWDQSLKTSIGMYSTSQSTVLTSKPVIWASCFMQLVDEWQGSMFVHVVQDVGYRTGFCQVRKSLHFWHLKTWHEQHGPMSQLTMISDVLSIDFKRNVPLDQTIQQICATNKAIWAMGVPSPEVFLSLLLVQSLPGTVQRHRQLYRGGHEAISFYFGLHHQLYHLWTS